MQSVRRQNGALLLLFGLGTVIKPLANIAQNIGPAGTSFVKVVDKPEIGALNANHNFGYVNAAYCLTNIVRDSS